MSERRTGEEIEKEIKAGKEFITRHPRSFFGDDNVASYNLFIHVIELFKKGYSRDFILDKLDDEGYDEDETNDAWNYLDWLFKEVDDGIYT